MFGKPEWFGPRKYTGWGLTPRTWQGWVYIIVFVAPIAVAGSFPLSESTKTALMTLWALIFVIDFIDIMLHLRQDERERLHEAIAERNALWTIIVVLAVGFAYETVRSAAAGEAYFNPVILIALFAGLAVKAISNYYLDHKD